MKHLIRFTLVALLAFAQAAFAMPERVNVNSAPAEQLAEALAGVGAARAQAIVDYREKFGEFVTVEDLLDVRGIGPQVLEANREKIALTD